MSTHPSTEPSLLPSVFPRHHPSSPPQRKATSPLTTTMPASPSDTAEDLPTPSAEPSANSLAAQPYIPPASPSSLLPPTNFRPFFTVVSSLSSAGPGTTASASGAGATGGVAGGVSGGGLPSPQPLTTTFHHPSVHYLFSDDDHELLAAAAMRSLDFDDAREMPPSPSSPSESASASGVDSPGQPHPRRRRRRRDKPTVVSALPAPRPGGAPERYVLVDVDASGTGITGTRSLSAGFQALGARVAPAPTWEEDGAEGGEEGGKEGAGALMLVVEGVDVPEDEVDVGSGGQEEEEKGGAAWREARRAAGDDAFAGLEGLVARLEREAKLAAKIVGTGDAGAG